MEDRYIATLVLGAVGDTIGYGNGQFATNYKESKVGIPYKHKIMDTALDTIYPLIGEFVSDFVDLGGITGIPMKKFTVSENTFMNIAVVRALAADGESDLIDRIRDSLWEEEKRIGQMDRIRTGDPQNSEILAERTDMRDEEYDPDTIRCGAAVRAIGIGLAFGRRGDRNELIRVAVQTGRLTHNSPIGFLGSLTVALFVSFAIQDKEPKRWPHSLIRILESQEVRNYVNRDDNAQNYDYIVYIRNWKRYAETRFQDGEPIRTNAFRNLYYRMKYYFQNFSQGPRTQILNQGNQPEEILIGGLGFSAPIVAYDCFLSCNGSFERLIYYAMLNPGVSHVTGMIGGAFYGAARGFRDVPTRLFDHLETKDQLLGLARTLFSKYSERTERS